MNISLLINQLIGLLCLGWLLIFAGYYIWSITVAAPYVPSLGKTRQKMLARALEYWQKNRSRRNGRLKALELGAGDANLSFALAKIGYRTVAIERQPYLALFARIRKLISRERKIQIARQDIFKWQDWDQDLVIVYLYPHLMERLEPILFGKLPKGAWIISNTFHFTKRTPLFEIGKVIVYEVN